MGSLCQNEGKSLTDNIKMDHLSTCGYMSGEISRAIFMRKKSQCVMKDIAVMIISLCRNTAPLLKKKNGLLATTN